MRTLWWFYDDKERLITGVFAESAEDARRKAIDRTMDYGLCDPPETPATRVWRLQRARVVPHQTRSES